MSLSSLFHICPLHVGCNFAGFDVADARREPRLRCLRGHLFNLDMKQSAKSASIQHERMWPSLMSGRTGMPITSVVFNKVNLNVSDSHAYRLGMNCTCPRDRALVLMKSCMFYGHCLLLYIKLSTDVLSATQFTKRRVFVSVAP